MRYIYDLAVNYYKRELESCKILSSIAYPKKEKKTKAISFYIFCIDKGHIIKFMPLSAVVERAN